MDHQKEIKPMFSGDFGYLRLLDNIIKIANGWLMTGNYKEYYLALESWYLTIIERLERNTEKNKNWGKRSKDQKEGSLEILRHIRVASKKCQHETLTKYHEELERLTALAGLRLRDEKDLPGVAKNH